AIPLTSGGTTTTSAPGTPTNLSATLGNGQVSLSWNAAAGAASYNIYRATTSGGEGSTPYVTGITGTTFTDTGLTNGTIYYYKVTAINNVGQSSASNEVSAIPQATNAAVAVDSGGGAAGAFQADSYF